MTAYLGAPIAASTLVYGGEHSLLRQSWAPRELLTGSVNADGWGVAWWRDGRAVRLARAEPAWYDPGVRAVLEGAPSGCGVAAIRNATPGIPVGPHAVAPFVRGPWAFVLNGWVPDFRQRHMRALRRGLPDELYGALTGSSDTETLFLLAVRAMDEGASPGEALQDVVRRALDGVEERGGGECQLALLLADGREVAVALASNVERTHSLYVVEGGRLAPDGVLVASERLDDDGGWRRLPAHHLLTVQEAGVEIRPLERG
ncbi:MAG: class II glutamine amidotransferase [Gemmatimonadota bacterium]|jgi:glutamine amidotransferase